MKNIVNHIVISALLLSPTVVTAADAEAGKTKAATCFACHGENGIGISGTYPNLAGQKEAYLISSIKAYKDGQRSGGLAVLMVPMVSALSDADIADIAAYYSEL